MKSKETQRSILESIDPDYICGMSSATAIKAMTEFANLQQRAALTKFKADAIYCNDGIAKMNIEDYLNVEVR